MYELSRTQWFHEYTYLFKKETFLALSADTPTQRYGTEYSNGYPYLASLRLKGFSNSKMKW